MTKEQAEEYFKKRVPANPAIIRVWEVMQENGMLDGLSDEEVLQRVLDGTEKVLDHLNNKTA